MLVVGSNGLLGQKVVECFRNHFRVFTCSVEDHPFVHSDIPYHPVDITRKDQVEEIFARVKPEIVFNAAAYTHVDRAEEERELCYAVNVTGVHHLAQACTKNGSKLVHISTDYVFDGRKGDYQETDEPNPLGYYGWSKLAGEKEVEKSGCPFLIARTAVLFGHGVRVQINFATWVFNQLRKGKEIRVVDDQIGNPTLAENLATAIAKLLQKNAEGLFHLAGAEPISRYHFALAIAKTFDFDPGLIQRIHSQDFPQKAPRPMNASLNVEKARKNYGVKLFSVAESLRIFKQSLFY